MGLQWRVLPQKHGQHVLVVPGYGLLSLFYSATFYDHYSRSLCFPSSCRSYPVSYPYPLIPESCLPRVQKPHRLQWFATPITCHQCSTVGTEISSYRHLPKIIQQCQGRLPARSFLTCLFEIGKAMSRRDCSTMLIKRN